MIQNQGDNMAFFLIAFLVQAYAWAGSEITQSELPKFNDQVITKKFSERGWSCNQFDRSDGMTCKGHFQKEVYPEAVAIIIPPSFRKKDYSSIVLHMHGWVDDSDEPTLDDTLKYYRYDRLFSTTGRNSVLVVPRSNGHCETFNKIFGDEKSFNSFVGELENLLSNVGLSERPHSLPLTLTGHSGAYKAIGSILTHSLDRVREVYMFDSIYDDGEKFVKFASLGAPYKFYSVFIPIKNDKGQWKYTAYGNHSLWRKLHPTSDEGDFEKSLVSANAGPHIIRAQLQKTGQVFQASDVHHVETFLKYFSEALAQKRTR